MLYYLSGILILIIFFLFLNGNIYAPEPPEKEIEMMQEAVAAVRKTNASEYAKKDFSECMELYDSTMNEWRKQNEKWILVRNFSALRDMAILTAEQAHKTSVKAIEVSGSLKKYVADNIEDLKQRDLDFRTRYKNFPFDSRILKAHSTASLKLLEAIERVKRGDLLGSFNRLVEAETGYSFIETETSAFLKKYFASFDYWKKMYNETINVSKSRGSYAVIVDKMLHKLWVVKNGKITRRYDAELSEKWIGSKIHAGDNATPEGKYFITKKLGPKNTKFHKALLINYPNEGDIIRHREAVSSGTVPRGKGIGGLIEIHGNGGKGKDWTSGCIALTDKDMDQLFATVSTGTPVTIIGSTVPLKELFPEIK